MVKLVEQMLELHQQYPPPERRRALPFPYARRRHNTQIDRLVYDLYGLIEDEIKIVEGAT